MEIAHSTPRYRFDVKAASAPAAQEEQITLTEAAETFVTEAVSDDENPVVLFALGRKDPYELLPNRLHNRE